jgi:predicted NBD/HSP70 family sugar kinase
MLTLASAFRLRNKLKETIGTVTTAIESAEFTKNTGTEENTSPCDGKTLAAAIREGNELMDLLQAFNVSIEKANLVNREGLIALETFKAKIAFYEKLVQKCRCCRKYEFEFDEKGERVKVAKEALVDQGAITSMLAKLKKEKDALEDRIAGVNFSTPVDFDPEAILSRI